MRKTLVDRVHPIGSSLWAWSLIVSFTGVHSMNVAAGSDDMEKIANLFPQGRHLAELSYTSVDTVEGDLDILLPRYTYAYRGNLRLSAAFGVAVSEFDENSSMEEGTGITDTSLLVQYDPTSRLTANAFVPDTLGFTLNLQVPSGDHDKGIGEDLWKVELGAGWLVDFPLDFWLLPSIQYSRSFKSATDVPKVERTDIGLGLYWLFPFKTWLGIEPVFGRDHSLHDEAFDIAAVVGKVWSSGWGIDLRWAKVGQVNRNIRDDKVFLVGLTYQFGQPALR